MTTQATPSEFEPRDERAPRVLIEIENVHKRYGDHVVFDGLSMAVREGESVVVMGESGTGKSQLIALMNALVLPDEGSVRIFGKDTREMSRSALMSARERIGTMFQNYALFDSLTVTENVAFPLVELKGQHRRDANKQAQALLTTLGLQDAGGLYPSSLSGGMKKRVSLARALITDPQVVLFDEPTTGLDPVMIEFVDKMLLDAQKNYDLTSVIISHDMASAFHLADRLAMLHNGAITFMGTPEQARQTDRPEVQKFIQRATSRLRETEAESDAGDGEQTARFEPADEEAGLAYSDLPKPEQTPLITIEDVHKSFGDRKVLRGVSLYILPQQITTVIGGSGSGKSVLMKHILGLFQPDAGRVRVFGQDMAEVDHREMLALRERFGMLFQSAALFDSMSIVENTMFPLIERPSSKISRREAKERAMDTLEQLKIQDLADKMPSDISGGQTKRAGLARAIVTRPEVLIYDEPTTGLDPVMTSYVNDMIVEAQESFDITALVVSHDMASTFRISHRIAMLYHGHMIAFGSAHDVQQVRHEGLREFIYAGTRA